VDTGWIANHLARSLGYAHRIGGRRAGDSAGEIDRAAVPVACTIDGVTERKSDTQTWEIVCGRGVDEIENRQQ
jgi:hypothetical protein